jgi:aspartate/methionine/tyrosine aminotransferase
VVQPGYHLLIQFAAGLGCRLKTWRLDPDNVWRPSIAELELLVGERTRAIVVNFPHNPTGSSITRQELSELAAIAEGAGAYVLWDAAFSGLVYDTEPLPPISTLYERGIDFGTFSKGLRSSGSGPGPRTLLSGAVGVADLSPFTPRTLWPEG